MSARAALRAAAIALLATATSVALPISAAAQDFTCERGDLEVLRLEFRGNRAFSDGDLALRVATTPSSRARRTFHLPFGEKRCLDRRELPTDMLRLKDYYRERGYYSTQVDTLVQSIANDAVRVVFLITEGAPTRLTSYTITGLDGVPEGADILRRMQLRVGEPFDLRLFAADIDTIISRLRDAGFYRANQIRGHDLDTTSAARADAFITVLPGKRAKFGNPVFDITPLEGRGIQIDTSVVRRVLGIQPGTQYGDRAIVEAQRNLFQLGTYRHIEVAPQTDSLQPPGDTIVVLRVSLTEDYMRQLDSEFGWGTLDCGRVRLQYTDKNLFSSARRLELSGQASKIGYGEPLATKATRDACTFGGQSPLAEDSAFSSRLYYFTGLAVRQPRLLGTRWVPTLSVYSERRGEFKAFLRTTEIGADLSATRELGDRMPLRLGYTFEYGSTRASEAAFCVLFNRCDAQSRDSVLQRLPLGVASAAISRVRTDNPITPRRGTLLRAQLRSSASSLLGSSERLFFNKATGDAAWYSPVNANSVVALRLRGGVVLGRRLGFADPRTFVPPQERLYAGGPTSVRGFQQNELGAAVYIARTRDVVVDTQIVLPDTTYGFRAFSEERAVPLGGNALVVTNLEYRIRDPFFLPELLQYTLFLDGGDVRSSRIRFDSLKWTPGLGVRALTPVGPVQVNIGYNGHRRERGPLYYNPDVTSLACASPGNDLRYRRDERNQLVQVAGGACPLFDPPRRRFWYQRLTFTFSLGPDF